MFIYSRPTDEPNPWRLPNVEVFHISRGDGYYDEDGCLRETGWYFHYCFPGCLPDSDFYGPYPTQQEAIDGAREYEDD